MPTRSSARVVSRFETQSIDSTCHAKSYHEGGYDFEPSHTLINPIIGNLWVQNIYIASHYLGKTNLGGF